MLSLTLHAGSQSQVQVKPSALRTELYPGSGVVHWLWNHLLGPLPCTAFQTVYPTWDRQSTCLQSQHMAPGSVHSHEGSRRYQIQLGVPDLAHWIWPSTWLWSQHLSKTWHTKSGAVSQVILGMPKPSTCQPHVLAQSYTWLWGELPMDLKIWWQCVVGGSGDSLNCCSHHSSPAPPASQFLDLWRS